MILKLVPILALLAVGCSKSPSTINRLEMRLSGRSALDVSISRDGKGRYHYDRPLPQGVGGTFAIQPQQFSTLIKSLEPFRAQAVPVTEKSLQEFTFGPPCPAGVPYITDAGAVWIHWEGAGYNEHYLADLSCDPERNAARNKVLLGIMSGLPIPRP